MHIGKLQVALAAGASTNILLKAKLETTVVKGFYNSIVTVDNLQGLKNVYFSGLFSAGINYKILTGLYINFNPTMRFAINPINTDVTVTSYPKTFVFALGLKKDL